MQTPKHACKTAGCLMVGILHGLAAIACGGGSDRQCTSDHPPILVAAAVHMDPLPTLLPLEQVLEAYGGFRDGMLWYVDLAEQTGLRISTQCTGVYADAVIYSGHEADLAEFMPGENHHLGTHLHSEILVSDPLGWEANRDQQNEPDYVLRVFNDNIPLVNQLFVANGYTAADNWYFHGTHASFPGMEGPLYLNDGSMETAYPNVFDTGGASRGIPFAFRGRLGAETTGDEAERDGKFVKISAVGGIIGFDQEHGPEGMVYGTLPYQRRDFLRVFIEWRENVRNRPDAPPMHFNFMVHPYQLVEGRTGTDERTVRESIAELVDWLGEEFVNQADPDGRTIAIYGTVPDIRKRFLDWEAAHPDLQDQLTDEVNDRTYFRRLPGIHAALEKAYHVERLALGVGGVTAHRFVVRDTGDDWVLIYSDAGTVELPSTGHLPVQRDVMAGDGTVTNETGETLTAGESPVLVAPEGSFAGGPP